MYQGTINLKLRSGDLHKQILVPVVQVRSGRKRAEQASRFAGYSCDVESIPSAVEDEPERSPMPLA